MAAIPVPPGFEPRANPEQLRHDIDSGRTGDKVAGVDPAAAPLGTDEEAGGWSPEPELVAITRVLECMGRPNSARANCANPDQTPDGVYRPRGLHLAALAGAAAGVCLGVVFLVLL